MIFKAKINDGVICYESGKKYFDFIKKNDGKKVIVDVDVNGDIRTHAQNRFFHGVIIKELLRLGSTQKNLVFFDSVYNCEFWVKDTWKLKLCSKYFPIFDEYLQMEDYKRTRDLTVEEFSTLINRTRDDVILPNGGDITPSDWYKYMKMMEEK